MLAVIVKAERDISVAEYDPPPPPDKDEVQLAIRAVALNHIDVWGWRGMVFAKRKLPLIAGVEAAGEIVAIGENVSGLNVGQLVAPYGALTCGACEACEQGRDNFCEQPSGIYGFHIDGFCRELINIPAHLAIPAPDGLDPVAAACTTVTFGTVEHMLFDNAQLKAGQTILVQAGGSGIGTAAIQLAKAAGATVITTVGDDAKAEKALALGATHAINYNEDRFEGVVRKLTGKKGVDVVFEHVGTDTWEGSLFSLKRGGCLVTCGSTTGMKAQINLYQLFQQQQRIFGSFGCTKKNVADALEKLQSGVVSPVIDTSLPVQDIGSGLKRLESRKVFGKVIVTL
ncbi:Alcohol dehydrogenase [hydrothermal vent metagenome]|uniref:Alcohol dehydrogenase n=1 Tax=hydrothermal vent metagenome TaxID=652676 RepID=A0A3B0TIS9_9ZZZZ